MNKKPPTAVTTAARKIAPNVCDTLGRIVDKVISVLPSKSVPPELKKHYPLMYSLSEEERTTTPATGTLTAFMNCCSASILYGICGGRSCRGSKERQHATALPYNKCSSIRSWTDQYRNNTLYFVPKEYRYCLVLYNIWRKTVTRPLQKPTDEKHPLYNLPGMATKTIFIIDRDKRSERSASCCDFIQFLEKTADLGTIYVAKWVPGAHGGHCKGAVWTPDTDKIEALLTTWLSHMNAHSEELARIKKVPRLKDIVPVDDVAALWHH